MAAAELYPLATQDGKAIPLEVARPLSLVSWTMLANTAADITIPAGYGLVWVYATVDCIIRFSATNLPNALVSNTPYTLSMFIPAATPMTIMAVPGEGSLLGLAAGTLYMNSMQQWAAITQAQQTSIG